VVVLPPHRLDEGTFTTTARQRVFIAARRGTTLLLVSEGRNGLFLEEESDLLPSHHVVVPEGYLVIQFVRLIIQQIV